MRSVGADAIGGGGVIANFGRLLFVAPATLLPFCE
jgi:hypothetical protein